MLLVPARGRLTASLGVVAVLSGLLLAACGDAAAVVPQADKGRDLTAPQVVVQPIGDTSFAVVGTPTFILDNAGLLVIKLTVESHASVRSSVTMAAVLRDLSGTEVSTATGGAVNLDPGSRLPVQLNGPAPTGVIARVDLTIGSRPAPS